MEKKSDLVAEYANLVDDYRHLKKAYKKLQAEKKISFSKIVMALIMASYFAGLAFGVYAMAKILLIASDAAAQALIALFSYIGVPTGVAIGFYSWKAKNENVKKIEQSYQEEE